MVYVVLWSCCWGLIGVCCSMILLLRPDWCMLFYDLVVEAWLVYVALWSCHAYLFDFAGYNYACPSIITIKMAIRFHKVKIFIECSLLVQTHLLNNTGIQCIACTSDLFCLWTSANSSKMSCMYTTFSTRTNYHILGLEIPLQN